MTKSEDWDIYPLKQAKITAFALFVEHCNTRESVTKILELLLYSYVNLQIILKKIF